MNFLVKDDINTDMPPPPGAPPGSPSPAEKNGPPERDTASINGSYIAFGILLPITLCFLLARCYTALRILRRWRVDDTLILVAFILTTAAQCLVVRSTIAGVVGVHVWDITPEEAMWDMKIIHATTLLVIPGTVLAKVVLCFFYYRLSPYAWYRYSILATAAVMVGAFVSVWFAILFTCVPLRAIWDFSLRMGPNADKVTCIDQIPLYIFQAVMSAWSDFMLIVLPLPNILTLQALSKKQKLGLVAWFGTGLLALGSSVARLVVMLPTFTSDDPTYVAIKGDIGMIVESSLLVLCGCLPTFRLFLHDVVAPMLTTRNSSSSSAAKTQSPAQKTSSRGTGGGAAGMVYAMRTIGGGSNKHSKNKRGDFDSIDDDDDGSPFNSTSATSTSGGGPQDSETSWYHPPKSPTRNSDEEGIIKTIQTSVTYAPR